MNDLFYTDECWEPLDGYSGYYISNYGRVYRDAYTVEFYSETWGRHITKRYDAGLCSLNDNGKGYYQVGLRNPDTGDQDRPLVHRLVMQCFGGEPPTERHTDINHIDGDRTNNHISNLQWVTPAENKLHAFATKVAKKQSPERVIELATEWL